MSHLAMSKIFFRQTYIAPVGQTVFDLPPHDKSYAAVLFNVMATGHLVAMFELICAREIQAYLADDEETLLSSLIDCRHRAPIPPGALITVDGSVTGISDQEVTFWVRASDEQEIVCEGQVRFAIFKRLQLERKIQRKREAIGRRQLFAAA